MTPATMSIVSGDRRRPVLLLLLHLPTWQQKLYIGIWYY